eukprot:5438186-Pyramimonas_sp.AAC.1
MRGRQGNIPAIRRPVGPARGMFPSSDGPLVLRGEYSCHLTVRWSCAGNIPVVRQRIVRRGNTSAGSA